MRRERVKLDMRTNEIYIYGAEIVRVNQDRLGRVFIKVEKRSVNKYGLSNR
jgi:uncharacterized protein YlxW (UPF0749 family)